MEEEAGKEDMHSSGKARPVDDGVGKCGGGDMSLVMDSCEENLVEVVWKTQNALKVGRCLRG